MFNDIQSVLINKFDEIDWIDEETRSNAQRKAKAMNRFIGYSDQLLNTTIIDGLYETVC
jgi:predicted metalloendopeptidase